MLYSENLADTLMRVKAGGGEVIKAMFEFPGGRWFHFADPCGNEWAVWSDH